MKTTTTTLLVSLLLFLGSARVMAQEDNIFGAIMEAAAAQENASNQAQAEANSEAAAVWKEEWEKNKEKNAEIIDAMDTKYLKCTAMMVLYVQAYLKLINEHKIGELTMSACDAYGMQTLALATSTTIMYCPEKMAQLSDEELKLTIKNFATKTVDVPILSFALLYESLSQIRGSYMKATDYNYSYTDFDLHVMKYLIEFFRPRYIIPRTLEIAQEMEAMGCSKPN